MRETCPNKARCGKTGHYWVTSGWIRCECLKQELYKAQLGVFATPEPVLDTPLLAYTRKSALLDGPLALVKRHVAGVFLKMKEENRDVASLDAYRLVEIFLDKDEEYKTTQDLAIYDLLVILLGFGDIKNQRLPDILMQAFKRRELLQRPTWVILGLPIASVAGKYSAEIADELGRFEKIAIR